MHVVAENNCKIAIWMYPLSSVKKWNEICVFYAKKLSVANLSHECV